jgi:hypothetical protein
MSGWFSDRALVVDPTQGAIHQRLVGVVDYGVGILFDTDAVLLRVFDLYIQYNRAKAYNFETDLAHRDRVVVVEATALSDVSNLLASLSEGQSFSYQYAVIDGEGRNLTIEVCAPATSLEYRMLSIHFDDGQQSSTCSDPVSSLQQVSLPSSPPTTVAGTLAAPTQFPTTAPVIIDVWTELPTVTPIYPSAAPTASRVFITDAPSQSPTKGSVYVTDGPTQSPGSAHLTNEPSLTRTTILPPYLGNPSVPTDAGPSTITPTRNGIIVEDVTSSSAQSKDDESNGKNKMAIVGSLVAGLFAAFALLAWSFRRRKNRQRSPVSENAGKQMSVDMFETYDFDLSFDAEATDR